MIFELYYSFCNPIHLHDEVKMAGLLGMNIDVVFERRWLEGNFEEF